MIRSFAAIITLFASLTCWADSKPLKGTLPELAISEKDESANMKKAAKGEVLISQTENQAINSLTNIIKKKRGTPQEPELWFRLGELYMRRAKSGRFFDLNRNQQNTALSFAPSLVAGQTAVDALTRASKIYLKIEKDFPLFAQMDFVMFNAGFAFEQLKQKNEALEQYRKMLGRFPKSSLVPDALLASGEIEYEKQNYQAALNHFIQIENHKSAKVYPYGKYKAAWSYYNLQNSDQAFHKLEEVVSFFDQKPGAEAKLSQNHNLRQEALKDLALFYTESKPIDQAYEYFANIADPLETAKSIHNVSLILASHSREKEAILALEELTDKQPNSEIYGLTKTKLIEIHDAIKQRDKSLLHAMSLKKTCQDKIGWQAMYPTESEKICLVELPSLISKLAKKWWESWQRNPTQKDLSDQVKTLLEIQLADQKQDTKQSLEIQQTNAKLRLAYSDLLFQTNKFDLAKENYLRVYKDSVEPDIQHQALYASIVSSEKQNDSRSEQLRVIDIYLKAYPTGEWSQDLKFKQASLLFLENQFEIAKPIFLSLADPNSKTEVKQDIRNKSQDLYLDILAKQKDFEGIYTTATLFKNNTRSIASERSAELDKIILDSDLASTQEKAEQQEIATSIKTLMDFYERNKTTEPGKESFWQAVSKSFAADRKYESAQLAVKFAVTFPKDSRSEKALKDAAKNFLDVGFTNQAADVLKMTSDQGSSSAKKAALELSVLDKRYAEADKLMNWFIENTNGNERIEMINVKIKSLKDRKAVSDLENFEKWLLSQKIEPYAGELKLKKIQASFQGRSFSEAFNSAKGLVGDSTTSSEVRAGARLIQAKVLSDEFLNQSTKTTIDRLPLVLSIKTEKLDKAQTAFLSAAKISDSAAIRLEALSSLNILYQNYVDTVGSPQLKSELSDADRQALQTELNKLVAPIQQKLTENSQKIAELSKQNQIVLTQDKTRFEDLPDTATLRPQFRTWNFSVFKEFEDPKLKGVKCEFKSDLNLDQLILIGRSCEKSLSTKNKLDQIIIDLANRFGKTEWPLYFQARLAWLEKSFEKSVWLAEEALKLNPKNPYVTHVKGLAKSELNSDASTNTVTQTSELMPIFLNAKILGHPDERLKGLALAAAYSQNQCPTVLQKSEFLSKDQLAKLDLTSFVAECVSEQGQPKLAVEHLQYKIKQNVSSETHLHLARIYEHYLTDIKSAIREYEKARQLEKDSEVLAWIDRKLGYLKIPKSMSQSRERVLESKGAYL